MNSYGPEVTDVPDWAIPKPPEHEVKYIQDIIKLLPGNSLFDLKNDVLQPISNYSSIHSLFFPWSTAKFRRFWWSSLIG